MDLTKVLRSKIEEIPDGAHSIGLKSVLGHIEAAERHYLRGKEDEDDTAFTDAIYRTNQAFEGSVKEAYRILTGKDPSNQTPHNIEKYLADKKIFRERVLSQFTNYRSKWRNPSTHDYNLDFDENEALLAIMSVSAFSAVLIDQIVDTLLKERAEEETGLINTPDRQINNESPLFDRLVYAIKEFVPWHRNMEHGQFQNEAQIVATLAGYITKMVPDANPFVKYQIKIGENRVGYIDILVSSGNDKVVVEVKKIVNRFNSYSIADRAAAQLKMYMDYSDINDAILFIYSSNGDTVYENDLVIEDMRRIKILTTYIDPDHSHLPQ
jgi:hypothetical protein